MHVEYRKGLNVLFTRRALASYLPVQERIFRRFFERWIANPNPKPERHQMEIRDLNMEVSLRIFCGSYIPAAAEAEISDKYWLISKALELVNFPLALPGTKVYRAIQARKVAMRWFEHASAESKKRMAAGGEPDCMLDKWVKAMLDARAAAADGSAEAEAGEAKTMLVREYSDREIAMVRLHYVESALIGRCSSPSSSRRRTPCPAVSATHSSSSPTTRTSSPSCAPRSMPRAGPTRRPRSTLRRSSRWTTPTRS